MLVFILLLFLKVVASAKGPLSTISSKRIPNPFHKSPRWSYKWDCKTAHIVILTAYDKDKPVPNVWFYLTEDSGKMKMVQSNTKGDVVTKVVGCNTQVAAYKDGFDVATKTLELNALQVIADVKLYPPCNFWLYISDAESLTPVNNAKIIYTSKDVNREATTDGYGETCIFVADKERLRAIVQKSSLMPGIVDMFIDASICRWATVSLPLLLKDSDELKMTLNWAGDLYMDLCLNVLQFKKNDKEYSCLTNQVQSCSPLKYHNDIQNPALGGEMVTWSKCEETYSYVIFVTFEKHTTPTQARIVFYFSGGQTRMISCLDDNILQGGYWIVGCFHGAPKNQHFTEINEVSKSKPDQGTCDYWMKKKSGTQQP